MFSIARGRSAGKEGKTTFQAPKSFIFYRQRPVSRQGREKNFSGPKKFYFLSPEAGQQARKEKQHFRPQKVLFSIARGRSAGKEGKKLFRPQKVLFSIARGPLRGLTAAEAVGFRVCSRRALHLCDNVRDVTTQAQEAQRPIRLRFKNPCKRPWIVEKNFSEAEKFFSLGVGPWKEGPQATFFLRINEVKP